MAMSTTYRISVTTGIVMCIFAQLFGCSGFRKLSYSPPDLKAEVKRRVPRLAPADLVVPFAVSQASLDKARKAISPYMSASERARALLQAIFDPDFFGLRYAEVVTHTAEETIDAGEGNCLSLASVYVGLARGLGLRAYFLDASDRVGAAHEELGMLVRAGHITAVVETERGRVALDFGRRLSPFRIFRVMDDVESIAHFHNNRAYELIRKARDSKQSVDWKAVAKRFELATQVLPDFARAWNNLGVAMARLGRFEQAQTAYRRAIQADSEFPSPHTNLGILYLEAQNLPASLAAFAKATDLDPDSARAHHHLGVALFRAGRHAAARVALQRAIELDETYDAPRKLLESLSGATETD
jgi:tetratricopeptide (TPR) repeat protein